jgi:3-oxoacyl-[acyl-carrier-protein] synthase-3
MEGSPRATITALGSAVPKKVMTNADFEKILDTSDEWITKRTGIKERRLVSEGETTATLATAAARNALTEANLQPTDLDLIICATISPEMPFPATACFVQAALGATDVPAFDISAACSGFIYALSVASQFIETGKYRRVMVIGADALSRFADFTDRGSCILFGDGAGAAILEPTTEPDKGVIYSVMNCDGAGWDYIHCPAGGTREPTTAETVAAGKHLVKMRGRDVYKFAVEKMQWLLGDCMKNCGLSVDDVDMVIPHQVNIRIIESATSKYNFPMDKVYVNIDHMGNTSGASIPLAMDEAMRAGKIGPGSTVMLVAFGAGLTWAGAVLKL